MVVVDIRTNEAHENLSKTEAASLIGVNRRTIHRWIRKGDVQNYNSFVVYVRTRRHKQRKGKPKLPPQQIIRQNSRRW